MARWQIGPFQRTAINPVLRPLPTTFYCPALKHPIAWETDHVFNPAAVVRNDRVYVLYRAEDHSGAGIGHHTSRIGLASTSDGVHFLRKPAPVLYPSPDSQAAREWPGGCEDPRIVETADGGYVLMYTQWDGKTARLAVATSRDLTHWVKHGPAFAGTPLADTWSKSGAIVTRLQGDHLIATHVNGKYWMYWGEGSVSAATSTDLIHWQPVMDANGAILKVLAPRKGIFDSNLTEAGPPAVLTKAGIVLLYNGMNSAANGDKRLRDRVYSAGQALFDTHNPTRCIARPTQWFLTPERPYESTGQYAAGTVFIEGLVHWRRHWWLYYGTADSDVAAAVSS